ncbi:hypothetical protein [Paraburkholderia sediminicola]|uniref:hypothetical protein n=1 Tax=Paraburkholderia sediminicola TaxID=458836 RepID=UPI0038BB399B
MKLTRRSGCGATLIVGAGLEATHFQFCAWFCIAREQIQGDTAQTGEALSRILDSHAAPVFVKDHVEYRVHADFGALKEIPLEGRTTSGSP